MASKLKTFADQEWGSLMWLLWPLPALGGFLGFSPHWPELGCLFLLGFVLLHLKILWHELGHLGMGLGFGVRYNRIQVGTGWRLLDLNLGGLKCVWKVVPSSGFVQPVRSLRTLMLWPETMALAGGAIADALLLVVLIVLWQGWFLDETYYSGWVDDTLAYSWMLLVLRTSSGFLAIFQPRFAVIEGRRFQNDSMQLRNLWRDRAKLPARRRLWQGWREVRQRFATNDFAGAKEQLEILLEENNSNVDLLNVLGVASQALGQDNDARLAWEQALMLLPKLTAQRGVILDLLACSALAHPTPARLAEADQWTLEALQCDPAAITLKGTRGSALIALGRFDEGRPFLEETIRMSKAAHDQGISRAYLARAAFLEGNRDHALALFAEIRRRKVEHELIMVVEKELQAAGLELPA